MMMLRVDLPLGASLCVDLFNKLKKVNFKGQLQTNIVNMSVNLMQSLCVRNIFQCLHSVHDPFRPLSDYYVPH